MSTEQKIIQALKIQQQINNEFRHILKANSGLTPPYQEKLNSLFENLDHQLNEL